MTKLALNNELWEKLLKIMLVKDCYDAKNSRHIVEGILWKLRNGAPWAVIPEDLCKWQIAYGRFNSWSKKGLWDDFFSAYEAKLIRNRCSSIEVKYGIILMRVELGLEKLVLLKDMPPSLWVPMIRMENRSVLKSLGVKCTIKKTRLSII